jgi:hypothetical protein
MLFEIFATALTVCGIGKAQESAAKKSSYAPVVINVDFAKMMARMKAAKSEIMERQIDLLNTRYVYTR